MYTLEKAELISEQLRRFKDGYPHHAAGQYGNIDFWLNEALDAVKVIDEYKIRFAKMSDEQKKWVKTHNTTVGTFCNICKGRCEFDYGDTPPAPPIKTSSKELNESRKKIIDSAYYLLLKFYRQNLLDKGQFKSYCDKLGTSIDLADI